MSLMKYMVFAVLIVTVLIIFYGCTLLSTPNLLYSSTTVKVEWQEKSMNCHGLTKWVITTSSRSRITSEMISILDTTQDWCLLIIGTYSKLWTVPMELNSSHLIYLYHTDLKALPYMLVNYTLLRPSNWKNIGYLFAIEKGAQIIYDMDESNIPLPINGVYLPVEGSKQQYESPQLSEQQLKGKLLWKPLSYFQGDHSFLAQFPTESCLPIVQQHVAVLKYAYSKAFGKAGHKKIVTPKGIFAPYSGATIHLYEALWSLFLPTTVKANIAAVWRSYIAQSLFYLIPDACLMFIHPASLTTGMVIDIDDDVYFSEESFKLVEMLKYFPMTFDLFVDALLQLYQNLVVKGFVGEIDYIYMSAWVNDLKRIGYSFPKLPDKSKLWTRNVQLCIMFNWGATEYTIRTLLAYYMRYFTSVVLLLDGESPSAAVKDIPTAVRAISVRTKNGWFQQYAVWECLQNGNENENITSYLYIPDDMFINITQLGTLPSSKMWFNQPSVYNFSNIHTFLTDDWWWWHNPNGTMFLQKFVSIVNDLPYEWKKILSQNIGFPNRIHSRAVVDSLHVPCGLSKALSDVLLYFMSKTDIFCEIIIPLALDIAAGPQDHAYLVDGNLWLEDRLNPTLIAEYSKTRHYIHPLKLTTRFGSDIWCILMNEQLKKALLY